MVYKELKIDYKKDKHPLIVSNCDLIISGDFMIINYLNYYNEEIDYDNKNQIIPMIDVSFYGGILKNKIDNKLIKG